MGKEVKAYGIYQALRVVLFGAKSGRISIFTLDFCSILCYNRNIRMLFGSVLMAIAILNSGIKNLELEDKVKTRCSLKI